MPRRLHPLPVVSTRWVAGTRPEYLQYRQHQRRQHARENRTNHQCVVVRSPAKYTMPSVNTDSPTPWAAMHHGQNRPNNNAWTRMNQSEPPSKVTTQQARTLLHPAASAANTIP